MPKNLVRSAASDCPAAPQFFILFKETPWLDGRHVVFGKMIEGDSVLDKMEAVSMGASDRPKDEVTITDCGTIDVDTPYNIEL